MQKYVYGCYSAGTRKDGRLDRHIELTTDMRFAVVNHNTSDDVHAVCSSEPQHVR